MNTPHPHDDIREALDPGRDISMRPHELESSRVLLSAHIARNPVQAPWYVRAQDRLAEGTFIPRFAHAQHAFAALVLVVCVGTGTSYAAESAIPGDILYPVKKIVNENVRSAIALSPAAQVEWQSERVDRRLAEVTELAKRSGLTPSVTASVERDMSDAAYEIDVHTTAVIASNDTDEQPKIAKAQERMRESLKVRVRSLDAQASSDKSTSTREGIASIAAHVRGRFHTEDDMPVAAVAAMAADDRGSDTARDTRSARSGKRPPTARTASDSRDDDSRAAAPTAALMMVSATTSTTTPSTVRSSDDDDDRDDRDEDRDRSGDDDRLR